MGGHSILLLLATAAGFLFWGTLAGTNKFGKKFLEENAKKEGVITLPSGLQYKVLRTGNGSYSPVADSPCECHYEGRTASQWPKGKTFDSSYARGEPTEFAPNQVIKGWTEAMQMMVEGDKWEMYIPSELGYGDSGRPPKIKGGDVLVFTMEILKIKGGKKPATRCNVKTPEKCNSATAPSEISVSQVVVGWICFAIVICMSGAIDLRFISGMNQTASDSGNTAFVRQILFWLLAGSFFNLFILVYMGRAAAGGWFFGYILEYTLSVDNLFVFQLIFKHLSTPLKQIDRALFWGISIAVLLRLAFFAVGTEIMGLGAVPRIIFGLVLVYSGVKSIFDSDDEDSDPSNNPVIKFITARLPVHEGYGTEPTFFLRVSPHAGNHLSPTTLGSSNYGRCSTADPDDHTAASGDESVSSSMAVASPTVDEPVGTLQVTMLFVVVLTLSIIDVVFAVDSVTAKISSIASFGDLANLFLNLTSSAYAMFVLRSLYFVIHMLVHMFRFLNYGVGIVLVFIGAKLVISIWMTISMSMSCVTIISVLTISICVSAILPEPKAEDGALKNPQQFGNVELGDATPTLGLDAANGGDLAHGKDTDIF